MIDHVQDIDQPVVIDEDSAVGYLIGEAEAEGIEVDDIELANVTEAHLAYFDAIGAVGPPADDPDVLAATPARQRGASGPQFGAMISNRGK